MCSAQSTERIEQLLQEDQNAKRRRELCEKQSSLLLKLIRQLGVHDNRAAAATSWANDATGNDTVVAAIHPFHFCVCACVCSLACGSPLYAQVFFDPLVNMVMMHSVSVVIAINLNSVSHDFELYDAHSVQRTDER